MTRLAKKNQCRFQHQSLDVAREDYAKYRRGVTARDGRASSHPPAVSISVGSTGQAQQYILVPEESSGRVAWRSLEQRCNAGSWTPRMREVSTQTRKGQVTV